MSKATISHGRALQLGFAVAHLATLAVYLEPALDLARAGEFTTYFLFAAALLSAAVIAGCVPSKRDWAVSRMFLVGVSMLGAVCIVLWTSPLSILYVACAIGSAWGAGMQGNTAVFRTGAVAVFTAAVVAAYLCARLPLESVVSASERSAGDVLARIGTADATARAVDLWARAAARRDNLATARLASLSISRPASAPETVPAPAVKAALPPDPESVAPLPRFELGEALALFMPASGGGIEWEFNATAPVFWKTDGFETSASESGWRRVGLLRVDVLGTVSTVLRQVKHELAWEVVYATEAQSKFGVETITLQPLDCFGTTNTGCTFDPRPSMKKAGIAVVERCFSGDENNGIAVFDMTYPGRRPMQLRWINSAGSGGAATWLEMRPTESASPLGCEAAF
jgi:hypothetical protein